MKLTALKVENARKPGKYTDEFGLALRVSARGKKTWNQRLTIQGRQAENSIGKYPAMSLAEARDEAYRRWAFAQAGGDPRVGDENGKPVIPTFAEAAEEVIAVRQRTWRNRKSANDWRASLTRYAFPVIGDMPISEVDSSHVLAILEPVWQERAETAKRVRQRISIVCQRAVAQKHRTDDPAGMFIINVLGKQTRKVRHHHALPWEDVPECIHRIRNAPKASRSCRLAMEFLILCWARSGEVREAQWSEIDFELALWTVPARRMKANVEHRVPLSGRCIEILKAAQELDDGSGRVFPGLRPGRPLSENTFVKLLGHLGYETTCHGFRSAARDWASEQTATPHAVMEQALAHQIRNAAEKAYARSDLFDKRRVLMDEFTAYATASPE
ncbi:MAG: integrase arm-type DNA-binding domain-containing protein [Gammaproteobacteria bacterium]|nr:integrase arm-type DNA-binding domain-containing protein [Gammaproteobacteria bacterium]